MRKVFDTPAALKLIDGANGRRARVAALDGSDMSATPDHAIFTAQTDVADVGEATNDRDAHRSNYPRSTPA